MNKDYVSRFWKQSKSTLVSNSKLFSCFKDSSYDPIQYFFLFFSLSFFFTDQFFSFFFFCFSSQLTTRNKNNRNSMFKKMNLGFSKVQDIGNFGSRLSRNPFLWFKNSKIFKKIFKKVQEIQDSWSRNSRISSTSKI